MTFDPATVLILSSSLAAASALYLAFEWFSVRESSLLLWSSGFSIISVCSALALMRANGFLLIGIWVANGGLIAAHWLFGAGVASLMKVRLPRSWYLVILIWPLMLLLPDAPWWSRVVLCIQSLLIACITLHASFLLRPYGNLLRVGAVQLRYVLMMHGLFYAVKAGSTIVLGANLNLEAFQGAVIKISLGEGILAIILIALSMTGTERHRREQLTLHDPLTALYNRRALEMHLARLAGINSGAGSGVVLLINIDNFKQVNYLHGPSAGDKLLVSLSELIRAALPHDSIAARMSEDEFVILLSEFSSSNATALGNDLRKPFEQMARALFPTPNTVSLAIKINQFEASTKNLMALIERCDSAA